MFSGSLIPDRNVSVRPFSFFESVYDCKNRVLEVDDNRESVKWLDIFYKLARDELIGLRPWLSVLWTLTRSSGKTSLLMVNFR